MQTRSLTPIRIGLLALAFAFFAPSAFGQMPQPSQSQTLSSSDVSDAQLEKVARILSAVRSSTGQEQMKLRKDAMSLRKKMAEMDSTQKAQARRKMRKRQMSLRKKQMRIMQKQAQKEGMKAQMVQKIMRSTRQDSTLQQRLRQAVKAQMKQQAPMGGSGSGNGSPNQ
jgi:uncharacterized membrane protein YgaE (UPF0421/DUF939 family)